MKRFGFAFAFAGLGLAMGCSGGQVKGGDDEIANTAEQRDSLYLATNIQTWASNGNYIPVCWHNGDNSGLYNERLIAQAAIDRTWGANSNLHIDWRGTCPTDDSQGRFMMFGITRSTVSDHGMCYGYGMQTYSWPTSNYPGPRIWFRPGVSVGRIEYLAVHEFGHALGFMHEQDRPEAEAAACRGTDAGAPGTVLTPYDPDSVMNYCNSSGNTSGNITDLDKKGIAKVYGYPRSNSPTTRSRKPAAGSFTTAYSEVGRTDVSILSVAPTPGSVTYWCFLVNGTCLNGGGEWGNFGDIPVPGDYDGDGITDHAVWRPSDHKWYINPSTGIPWLPTAWGDVGDYPVPADYDGDGKTDIGVWRAREAPGSAASIKVGNWYVINSQSGNFTLVNLGQAGDMPVPADYDGDGHVDRATWRPSDHFWRIQFWNQTTKSVAHGDVGDVPVPGDYDGDGKADIAVWRPSNHTWYVINSSNNTGSTAYWGDPGDAPVPGDYDRDGKTDAAVWRPSNLTWYIRNSSNNPPHTTITNVGVQGYVPIPR